MPGIILAQVADQWWETVPAQIVLWASALAAVLYIIKKLFGGAEFARRLALALLSIGEVSQWPNGSTTLPSSLATIYKRQGETHDLVRELKTEFEEHIDDFHAHIERHEQGVSDAGD